MTHNPVEREIVATKTNPNDYSCHQHLPKTTELPRGTKSQVGPILV